MRNYLLDGLSVICEFSDSGDILREYVPGVCFVGEGVYFYHFDRLGSVRFLSDSAGSVVSEYVYDAFGNLVSSSGSISQPYQYVGREGYYREGELGLYLLGQRWYDEEVGRFISRDPIGEEEGVNLYVYGNNSPTILIDPYGLSTILPIVYLTRCYLIARRIRNQNLLIGDNHLRHCTTTCRVAEETDEFCAGLAGVWNEIMPGRSGRSGLEEDMKSNNIGLRCFEEINKKCSKERKYNSCEECCMKNRP